MLFEEIVTGLIEGNKFRRTAWPEDETHIKIVNEKLSIFKSDDKLYHPLTVSIGDLSGDDWVVC